MHGEATHRKDLFSHEEDDTVLQALVLRHLGMPTGSHTRSVFQARTQKTRSDYLMHTHLVDLNPDRLWKEDAVIHMNIPHPGTGERCGLFLHLQTW